MPRRHELEIKFKTDAAGLKLAMASKLLACEVSEASPRTLRSLYFDTAAGDLRKQRIALRIRKGHGAPQMGLKWPPTSDSPFSRREVEVEVSDMQPDISLFDKNIAAEIERFIEGRLLEPQFETVVKRRIHNMRLGRSAVEVAFDEGAVVAGDRRLPISEIELELKAGEEVELYDLAIRLVETLPLTLEVMSKAERGFMLACGERPQPVKDSACRLSKDTTLDEAITAIIASAIMHFVANWPALRETQHPESIHQMRVALRRLRAALAMFKRALPCSQFDGFRAEAQRIASVLGQARDYDMFGDLITMGPQPHYTEETSFEPLLTAVERRRLASYSHVLAMLDEPETTLFFLRTQEFLARRSWRNALSDEDLPRLREPAQIFATDTLDRLHKRVLKRGKGLVNLPDSERHRLRIALKNLRYAAEFFGDLFAGEAVKPYIHAVARLQDLLGAHNDAVSAERLLHDIDEAVGAQSAKAQGIVLGWYGRGKTLADADLRKSWKIFRRREIFWR